MVDQAIAKKSRFLWFLRWRPPPLWIFNNSTYGDLTVFQNGCRPPSWICWACIGYWDHTRWPLRGLYRWAKFGWDRCNSFHNMKLSIFCTFRLKTLIHTPKIGVGFGGFTSPPVWSSINETPKRHTLAWVRVVWAIERENRSTGLNCRWVPEKGINK